jgi:hypothetical protein
MAIDLRGKAATAASSVKLTSKKVFKLTKAFVTSLLFVQLVTSTMVFPGMVYVLDAYGVLPAALAPVFKEMKVAQKFKGIGIDYKSPECKFLMALIGASKMCIPINHFVLKGGLDLLYAIVGTFGFPLVIYVHRTLETDPIGTDVVVLFIMGAFWRIYKLGKSKVD